MSIIMEKIQWLAGAIDSMKGKSDNERTFLSGTTTLEELGLDSLDVVELQMMYEDAFNVELEDVADPINTVNDLLKLLEQH